MALRMAITVLLGAERKKQPICAGEIAAVLSGAWCCFSESGGQDEQSRGQLPMGTQLPASPACFIATAGRVPPGVQVGDVPWGMVTR